MRQGRLSTGPLRDGQGTAGGRRRAAPIGAPQECLREIPATTPKPASSYSPAFGLLARQGAAADILGNLTRPTGRTVVALMREAPPGPALAALTTVGGSVVPEVDRAQISLAKERSDNVTEF